MKTSRTFAFVAAALVIGFFAARWCAAQSARQVSSKEPATYDFGALRQLESFVAHLQATKQTNILQRFNDYSNASVASHHYANLGVTVAILQRLRGGRTNEAYELLEGQVDTDIISFVASYRELPGQLRERTSLKVFGYARDYRAKFPSKHRYPSVDEGVTDAFKILEEKATK